MNTQAPVKKSMMQYRVRGYAIIAGMLLCAFWLFYYSPWWMSKLTGEPVASFTISILQPLAVVLLYLLFFGAFSLALASVTQHMFKEKSFPWFGSRFAALFWLYFSSAVILAAFMMGSIPGTPQQ